MARWGDEKTLLFVMHYRSHECLWNVKSSLYKNNIARNNAYEALLRDMNDPSLTIKIIKTKIKNLRSVYHSEVKKINSSKRSGVGATDVYEPTMSWFTEMNSFMEDTNEYRETVGSELDSEASSQDSRPTDADSNSNPLSPPAAPSVNVMSPPSSMEDQSQSRSIGDTPTRRKRRNTQEEPITFALDRLENISSAINNRAEYDEFHYFGQNVAAQLRALPLYEALDVQSDIQSILTAARRRQQYSNFSTFTYTALNTQTTTVIRPAPNTSTFAQPAPNNQTMTFIRPANTQSVNYATIPAPNNQTMTFIRPANTQSGNYATIPAPNNKTVTFIRPANTQSVNYATISAPNTQFPAPNTQTASSTLPLTDTQTLSMPPQMSSQEQQYIENDDETEHELDLLNKAWKLS